MIAKQSGARIQGDTTPSAVDRRSVGRTRFSEIAFIDRIFDRRGFCGGRLPGKAVLRPSGVRRRAATKAYCAVEMQRDFVRSERGARSETPAIEENYTVREAIDLILRGFSLVAVQDRETGAIAVARKSGPSETETSESRT